MKKLLITADWIPLGVPVSPILDNIKEKLFPFAATRGYGGKPYCGHWLKAPITKDRARKMIKVEVEKYRENEK